MGAESLLTGLLNILLNLKQNGKANHVTAVAVRKSCENVEKCIRDAKLEVKELCADTWDIDDETRLNLLNQKIANRQKDIEDYESQYLDLKGVLDDKYKSINENLDTNYYNKVADWKSEQKKVGKLLKKPTK